MNDRQETATDYALCEHKRSRVGEDYAEAVECANDAVGDFEFVIQGDVEVRTQLCQEHLELVRDVDYVDEIREVEACGETTKQEAHDKQDNE